MTTVDIKGMFGKRAGGKFQNHRREFGRGVIVLLEGVDDPLPGSEINDTLSCDRKGNRSSLGRVLTFCFNRNFGVAKDIELSLGKGLLEHFTHFGRGSNRVEDARIGQARFRVIGNQLIAVGRDPDAGILRSFLLFGVCHGVSLLLIFFGKRIRVSAHKVPSLGQEITGIRQNKNGFKALKGYKPDLLTPLFPRRNPHDLLT